MDHDERIDTLRDAQDLLGEVIDLIERAIHGTELEPLAYSYLIPALKMAQTQDHEYLGSQTANLDELIHALKEMAHA